MWKLRARSLESQHQRRSKAAVFLFFSHFAQTQQKPEFRSYAFTEENRNRLVPNMVRRGTGASVTSLPRAINAPVLPALASVEQQPATCWLVQRTQGGARARWIYVRAHGGFFSSAEQVWPGHTCDRNSKALLREDDPLHSILTSADDGREE